MPQLLEVHLFQQSPLFTGLGGILQAIPQQVRNHYIDRAEGVFSNPYLHDYSVLFEFAIDQLGLGS